MNSTRAHSPVDNVYSPSSSAMPTPLPSSFPAVPPLPVALSSLGEDLRTVSRILAVTLTSKNQAATEADEAMGHRRPDCVASRLSSASDMSVGTIVPGQQLGQGLSADAPLHFTSEAERDTESTYSDSLTVQDRALRGKAWHFTTLRFSRFPSFRFPVCISRNMYFFHLDFNSLYFIHS